MGKPQMSKREAVEEGIDHAVEGAWDDEVYEACKAADEEDMEEVVAREIATLRARLVEVEGERDEAEERIGRQNAEMCDLMSQRDEARDENARALARFARRMEALEEELTRERDEAEATLTRIREAAREWGPDLYESDSGDRWECSLCCGSAPVVRVRYDIQPPPRPFPHEADCLIRLAAGEPS